MCSSQISVVRQQLDSVLRFLEPHLAFANCHMVDYFTQNLFMRHIPVDIQNEISDLGLKETLDLIMGSNTSCAPKLHSFISSTNNHALYRLKDVCLQREELENMLLKMGGNSKDSVNLKVFVSSKKSHEIEILSNMAFMLKCICNSTHVVDIGDGKGYLSSMLALHYKVPVLGIDSSPVNTEGAMKRADKLQKAWKNIMKHPTKSLPANHDFCVMDNNQLYKQITLYVDENINLKDLVSSVFVEESERCSLTGLHTCGNLSPTSLRVYDTHDYIKSICNVGCCYHLLTEKCDDVSQNQKMNGFPLSTYLQDRKLSLGRQARMLASQSIDRILANNQTDNKIVFYRAVFQVFLKKYHPELADKQIGRLKKPCNSFTDYMHFASKRIDVKFNLSEKQIAELYSEYEYREMELNLFYLLRSFLAQVVECVILVDRLVFLLEQGHNCSFLVQLFDRVLSPRCYGLISIKDF